MSNKPKFDPSQPFEVASKPKFDPTQPFEAAEAPAATADAPKFGKSIDEDIDRISKKYGISVEDLHSRQIGMGFYPEDQAQKALKQGNYGQHLVDAGASAVHSVVGEGLLGGAPSWIAKKLASDKEEAAIDELRAAVDHHKSGLAAAGEVILSMAPAAMASNAIKGVQLSKKVAKGANAAVNVAEGARAAVMESDRGEEIGDALTGGLFTAGIMGTGELIPKVVDKAKTAGRGLTKAVSTIVPGAEGASPTVNKVTAKLASMMPYQSASSDEILEVLSNPRLRRESAKLDFIDEASDLAPNLEKARDALKGAVDSRFGALERASLESAAPVQDLRATKALVNEMTEHAEVITEHKDLYGRTVAKLYRDVVGIFEGGGPKEKGLSTYGKGLFGDAEQALAGVDGKVGELSEDALQALYATAQEGARAAKLRTLHARRHLDDFMKNKNWESLSSYEKEAIGNLRNSLGKHLQTMFSGADERAVADALYSGAQQRADDFFKPLTTRSPSGDSFVDPAKIKSHVKTGEARGRLFKQRAADLKDFLQKQGDEIGEVGDMTEAFAGIDRLGDIGRMQWLQDNLNRAGGGPTSQAMNVLGQAAAASLTGGLSAAAYPITNPAGWVRIIDRLATLPVGNAQKYAPLFRRALEQKGPAAVAATHYVLMKNDAEYREVFEEFESVSDFKSKANEYLADKVVEPLARDGYPDLGAAVAAVPATALDAVLPTSPADFMPLGAIVHRGLYPFKRVMGAAEAKAIRESFDTIGGLTGKPGLYAKRVPQSQHAPRFDEFGDRIVDETDEAFAQATADTDKWIIFDADQEHIPVGMIDVDWSSGYPVSNYVQNFSGAAPGGHQKGLVKDFMEKFSQRAGELTSSMNFEPTSGRYLGQELWEDRLPRVVEVPGETPDWWEYRMLSPERFEEWQKANPTKAKATK